jgi:hypothetical protein
VKVKDCSLTWTLFRNAERGNYDQTILETPLYIVVTLLLNGGQDITSIFHFVWVLVPHSLDNPSPLQTPTC